MSGLGKKHLLPTSLFKPLIRDTPFIRATAALTVDDLYEMDELRIECQLTGGHTDKVEESEDEGDKKSYFSTLYSCWWCKECSLVKQEELQGCGLVYHSVQRASIDSKSEYRMDSRSPRPVGNYLFRLVQNGNRESAASQAFFDAGMNGWSTMFSCVTRDDIEITSAGKEKVKLVNELWKLTPVENSGTVSIFC